MACEREPFALDAVDSLYEYRLNAIGEGERKLPLLVQPRLGWEDDDCRPQSVPATLGRATNVRVDMASNVAPSEIRQLVPRLFTGLLKAVGVSWNPSYFTEMPHEYSRSRALELYVRLERQQATKLVRTDGIFHRIFQTLAGVEGSKFVYSADNTEITPRNRTGLNSSGPEASLVIDFFL